VDFRRGTEADYPAILALQAANFVGNLSPKDRAGGFLSAQFTPEQVDEIAGDLGIFVAEDRGTVVGWLCSIDPASARGSAIVTEFLRKFKEVRFRDTLLCDQRPFIYGPVAVDRAYRGRGTLRGLYEALLRELPGRFDVGVSFVAENNPHSLAAHVAGLGMEPVGRFEWNGNGFLILAFGVPGA
jgi:hypothetical protein